MVDAVLTETLRRALLRLVLLVGAKAEERETSDELMTRWSKATSQQGNTAIGELLKCNPQRVAELSKALKEAVHPPFRPENEIVLDIISRLRTLLIVDDIFQTNPVTRGISLLHSQEPEELTRKQIRAVELMLRALIQEQHLVEDELIERLQLVFNNKDVETILKSASGGHVLTGTVFSQLTRFFTDENEWKLYEPMFTEAASLNLLRDRRKTIQAYLVDIGHIRNTVYHHKQLSGIQIELLNLYYTELAEPVQRLFDAGKSRVNPRAIANVNREEVDRYFQSLTKELGKQREDLRSVRWIAIAILAIITATLVSSYILRIRAKRNFALEYQSLGWVTAQASKGLKEPAEVTSIIFLGDAATAYRDVSLLGATQLANGTREGFDLTSKLDPSQVGTQQFVHFKLPAGASTLDLCLIVPSKELGARFRVSQAFRLVPQDDDVSPTPVSDKIITKEDGTACATK